MQFAEHSSVLSEYLIMIDLSAGGLSPAQALIHCKVCVVVFIPVDEE